MRWQSQIVFCFMDDVAKIRLNLHLFDSEDDILTDRKVLPLGD
jgi:hypothetical protein